MYKSLESHIRGIMSNHFITEAKLGGKDYPHLDLCMDAIKQFKKDLEKHGDDNAKVHAAIKAVNDYLAIERKAIDGDATEDDHERMEDLVDVAKQKISDAGLTGHNYHKMHLDKVEDMIEGDDDDDMEEQNDKPPFTGGTKTTGPRKDRFGNVIKKQNVAKHLAKKAMRKQMGESVLDQPIMRANPEDNEPASPDEKGMALQQLRFIKYATDEIAAHIDGDGRFPEWMQNKLTKANYIMKGLHSYIDHEYSEGMSEEVDQGKLLSALKKKLSDEGGAAAFKPLKDVAAKMNVELTPAMLKGMSGIKLHRDGDYILESAELKEMFASTVEPHKDGFRPKVVKTQSGGKTTMSYLGQHVYKSKEHARNAADHIANAHRKGRASDSYIDSFARRHHKEHGLKESADVNLDEADFDKNFAKRVGATARGGKGADYLKKKADQTREYGAKQDPGAAKKGLGPSVVDRQKAYQKAKKKGLPPGQRVAYSGTYSKDKRRLPEEIELIEMKANAAYTKAAKDIKAYAAKNGGIDKKDMMNFAADLELMGRAPNILQAGQILDRINKRFKGYDTDVRDRLSMYLKKNGLMESVEEVFYGTQTQRLLSPLDKIRQDKEKRDRDRDGKLKPTALPMRRKKNEDVEEAKSFDLEEKAVSQQQQKLMGLALSVKRGDTPESEVTPAVRKMAKTMSTKELEKFAGTKHKGLPKEVEEVKSAPKGYHFTRSGQLKKGDADQDGDGGKMLRSDPLDKQRKKIPPLPESRFNRILENAIKKKS